jgi:hypothetical protein
MLRVLVFAIMHRLTCWTGGLGTVLLSTCQETPVYLLG